MPSEKIEALLEKARVDHTQAIDGLRRFWENDKQRFDAKCPECGSTEGLAECFCTGCPGRAGIHCVCGSLYLVNAGRDESGLELVFVWQNDEREYGQKGPERCSDR